MPGQKWTPEQKAKFSQTMARKKAERQAAGAAPARKAGKGLSNAGAAGSPATGGQAAFKPGRPSRSLERRLVEVLEGITILNLVELRRDKRLRARLVDAVEALLQSI